MNNEKNKLNQPFDSHDSYTSKIENIGASISTLGNDLLDFALELALDALESVNNLSPESSDNQSNQSESMRKHLDHLISELEGIKNIMNQNQ